MPEAAPALPQSCVEEGGRLEGGALTAKAIVFIVLAFAAPISCVVGTMPLAFALGNGAGVPGTILICALVMLCFVAGYAAMSRHVVDAGAFFAYITRGLGRQIGGGAAYVAVIAYSMITVALSVAVGYFAAQIFQSLNVTIPWWVYSFVMLGIVAFLGYRSVDIAAKVLRAALVLELAMIGVLDVGILIKSGVHAFSLTAFSPHTIFSGQAGIGFVFCFMSFVGIEATAIFGEEAKDPERTIPRASYGAIILIGVVYFLTSWSLLASYGASNVGEAAGADPSAFAFGASQSVLGTVPTDIMELLIITSFFAAFMAAHNATARYFFSLGRERLLPTVFGRIHGRWLSPHIASLTVTALIGVVTLVVAISGKDPYLQFAAPVIALGTVGIMLLQTAASVAVFVFFRRLRDRRVWATLVAPILAVGGLTTVLVLVLSNYDMVTGSGSQVANNLPWVFVVAAAVGIGVASYLKARRPVDYSHLGDDHGAQEPVGQA